MEAAQRAMNSSSYYLVNSVSNVSKACGQNSIILLENLARINEVTSKSLEINAQAIVKFADSYNHVMKNISPNLLNALNYIPLMDTARVFEQIKINIENNDIGEIIEDLNSYNDYSDSGINDFSEIEDTLYNDPIETEQLINNFINNSLSKLDKNKKIISLGTFLSLLLLIRHEGGIPSETIAYLDFFINGIIGLLMCVINDKSK
jgi:hypothetical protein